MKKFKIKVIEFITIFPVHLSALIIWVISSTLLSFCLKNNLSSPSSFILIILVFSVSLFLIVVLMEIIFRDFFRNLDYNLSYSLHSYFNVEKRKKQIIREQKEKSRKQKIKKYNRLSMISEVEKRPHKEISPIRRILIKNLEK